VPDSENRYAIVGMGGLFPDAPELSAFWRNLVEKRVSIGRLAEDSDERRIHFRPEVLKKADKQDKSYTDLLAAIDALDFDPEHFRIPPSVAKHMDDNQKVALLITEQAMAGHALDSVAKERIGVVMGNSGYGGLYHDFHRRFVFDRISSLLEHQAFLDEFIPAGVRRTLFIEQLREKALAGTFGLSEDSAPGMLPSIVAGRVSSVFDFHGQSMVVDAACASALAAILCGIQQLKLHQADAVVCGGIDMPCNEVGRIYFSAIGALSPDGSFPFDARANGFVIGQGGGVVILKRLADALENRDTIHAIVTGVGLSTDGKGKAIAAPNEVWQAQAIREAYQAAAYPVDTVELIEAHGTSTQVGDKSEVNALKRAFSALGCKREGFCGIGSVKSNIGHLKSAAGIAALLKATLALQNRWLPPSAGFERLSPAINLAHSPFYVLAEGKAWEESATPRRAGVSSFGFGGVNYHVALEEYRPGQYQVRSAGPRKPQPGPQMGLSAVALFAGATLTDLLAEVSAIRQSLQPVESDVGEILATLNGRTHRPRAWRLAVTVSSREDLVTKLDLVRSSEATVEALGQLQAKGIHFSDQAPVRADQVAVLFPGQGSQYPGMLGFVRRHFLASQNLETRANRLWQELAGTTVSALIDPGDDAGAAEGRLRETANTHPTVMTTSLAAYTVLEQMGLRPAVMLGHSLGEYTALVAAGRLSLGEGLKSMRARGRALGEACAGDGGTMLALPLDAPAASALIEESKLPLSIANRNSPRQTIVAGSREAIDELRKLATDKGLRAVILNVSRAFHSPLMQEAERVFEAELRQTDFQPSRTPVLSSVDAQILGDSREAVCATLAKQITSPVDFIAGIERLYADGIRVFIEVGPSSVLSGLTRDILGQRPGLVLSSDGRKPDSDDAFLRLLCGLHVAGLPIDASAVASTAPAEPSAPTARMIAPAIEPQTPASPPGRERIVYSGVSVGLPGSFKDAFRDDNFEQLFEGRNFIERLTDPERQALLDLHISKVVKTEQGASIVELQTLNEVIQLAGKLGRLDLAANYQVDDKELQTMSTCVAHAVAAGYEALRDAKIPLVLEYTRTSTGRLLPDRWALPREMQASTGIIFANGFPLIDPVIAEVSRHLSLTLGRRTREALYEFYDGLIAKVTHAETRKLLADWFALHYGRLAPVPSTEQVYRFNHQLMTQISLQANNRLAKRLNARGPNFQLNAACSSAATAIMLSEELIRAGRAERMMVIGADDPTSTYALPYLGAGFLATGACSNRGDLYEAALPFDKRRDGMIMGSGAMAIVIEAESQCARRGLSPVCELLGTHVFNAASHGSQLDVARYAEELEIFMARMERRHGLTRKTMAPELVYFSHEPYTPARGGCSESEATALRHVFRAQVGEVEVSNTKGMTGHTMGASIEDVTAAKALQWGRVPPVVNHKIPDPALEGLKLSKGSSRSFQYALRMAAGFGSQGNYVLLKRAAVGDQRITNPASYQSWLRAISGQEAPEVMELGRMLVIKDSNPGAVLSERPRVDCVPRQPGEAKAPEPKAAPAPAAQASAPEQEIRERVLDIVSSITGYKRSLLDLDMELEADLGVDTVKQATILATLAESFGMDVENVHLSDYPSLRGLVGLLAGKAGAGAAGPATSEAVVTPASALPDPSPANADVGAVAAIVREIVAHVTGYRLALVEPGMELEADLGVDTVKQATILAKLAERFGMSDEPDTFRISEFPTVGHLAAFFAKAVGQEVPAAPMVSEPPMPQPATPKPSSEAHRPASDTWARIKQLLAECTPYPAEMLEPDLTLDSDLGLDGQVRERFRQACIAAFDLEDDWQLPFNARIADLPAFLSASPKASGVPAEVSGRTSMARQILTLRPAALSGQPESLAETCIWIWGDDAACVQGLQTALQGQVRELRTMVLPASGDPEEAMRAAQQDLGRSVPDILIDTTACGTGFTFATAEPEAFGRALALAGDARFVLWKHLLGKKLLPGRTVAVTMVDGAHGLAGQGQPVNPLFGVHAGFYKSLRKLVPNPVIVVDLPPATGSDIAWAQLLAELSHRGPGVEICYRDGVRHRVVLADRPRPTLDSDRTLAQDEVVVVTGGGAGITAAIIKHLAERAPRHLAIIGRTALGPETRSFHALSALDRENQKAIIRERLMGNGEKATPVLVDKAYAALERAAEVHDTLAALKSTGAHVTYHEADVCDGARLASVLAEIRRVHGPITTLVHGAGIEVSRSFEKKSLEEFQSVLRTKALGAFNLGWLCREDPVRRVVALSSIAGRLGSPAQIDYAAGNGFLDLWARLVQHRPGVRGLSLIWSAWGQQGMAWRNAFVRENGERSGLGFIDPSAGAHAAVDEILSDGGDVEVVLHRGLGDVLDPELADDDPRLSPFIDWSERSADGVAFWRHFSPKRDAMLDQHRLGQTSLMPGVGLMEIMAEAHARMNGQPEGALVYRQLEFADALKFYRDSGRDLQLRVAGSRMEVWSAFHSPQGEIAEDRLYARAQVSREPASPPDESPALWDLGRTIDRMSFTRAMGGGATSRQGISLGPLLSESSRPGHDPAANQVVVFENGILTRIRLPRAQLSEPRYPLARLHVNPAFLDSMHQAAAIFCVLTTHAIHLPVGADEFTIFQAPKQDANYDIIARVCDRSSDRIWFNVAMLHEGRQIFCLARRVELRRTGQ
jgi:acyl transferase domain-containing protein/NAD(P)-dependent dehydrogenase (short-subunit alcohol dehydrogenase family)/acyl carrier protein